MYIYIYIHIEIRMGRLMAPMKSHKVQLEAMHSPKQSDFDMNFERKETLPKDTSKMISKECTTKDRF